MGIVCPVGPVLIASFLKARAVLGRLLGRGLFVTMLLIAWSPGTPAEPSSNQLQYRVMAGYLCNFAGFVEWPTSAFEGRDSPLIVGVVGDDAFASELERVAKGQKFAGRSLEIRRLKRVDSDSTIHILFIDESAVEEARRVFKELRGKPILTVTDSEAVFTQGAMINFVVVDDRVRFDVAPSRAETSQLHINARLLTAANRVLPRPM